MSEFTCPVEGCEKKLSKLQVMHFRSRHGCDPIEWVEEHHGEWIRDLYSSGMGAYRVASEREWLSSGLVSSIVDTRPPAEAMTGENNPMKREDVAEQFTGADNPAKQPEVRKKLSEARDGWEMGEEAKRKISVKNTGNEITEEHRQAISEAASEMDRSYMQTEEYSQALSDALTGREPTYPEPYEVEGLPHNVRSSWEEEIGKLLMAHGISYQYEQKFDLPSGAYYADFVSDPFVIEVKGWASERSVTNAKEFISRYDSYTYVVIGDELPCDVHLPWERRNDLIEVIEDG